MGFYLKIFIAIFVLTFAVLDQMRDDFYKFDSQTLLSIARESIATNKTGNELFSVVANKLKQKYPQYIKDRPNWIFNNAGGAMGQMWILHASLTEYVIIFGTPIGTYGHTGRYYATDYFIILEGEQLSFAEGQDKRESHKPGDMHILPQFHAKSYAIPDHCYALEYARGWVPLMLPFGILETFTSNLDFVTLGRLIYIYGDHIVSNLLVGKI
eukprot:TRINITY_DN27_c0_g1_i1.p1 TRINITY_DN27_c0_g1~~TRINITY_DN27_c0_g1_i1.p1  ORF type:complete len:212 (+),score=48.26 TRINITY_DN27_c0_g1_i1:54-689(+)